MIGQVLGHYRVLEQIGSGGMGVVYRAHDERLDRDVALKVLPGGILTDESARKRFRKEALALSRLNHPNIETVHDFDTQDGVDFLVMEHIPGITLDQKLAAGALPEKEVVRLGRQLAEALGAAHAEGIVHRDLKPGNLRLTPDGRLKILDFGLAKLLQPVSETAPTESLRETRGVAGTVPYMAPEQLRDEPVDARTDVWAAGAVLYELATGRRPFEAKLATALTDDIIHHPPPAPRQLQHHLSPRL
ncbi:MAG: serine/threonine-protein kinase, partial [Terriglobales bacterium]